ncbi:MAG: hypothetical protein A7315_10655 [Candidatus Altiarchaeales archaeon WOR_SM1_79]|nr:MAG: hypothetical protein A7315_10655 [Candidatus Altiarchaeales archaeon WOR_SM1_79]
METKNVFLGIGVFVVFLIMSMPVVFAQDIQCPSGCECLTEADAYNKSKFEKCSDSVCGYESTRTAKIPKYCYKSGQVRAGVKIGTCLTGCECLTEDNANTKFNGNYEKCSDTACGTYTIQKPDGSQVSAYKYCFREMSQPAQCPSGCECLDDAVAKEKEYNLCNNQKTECTLATGAMGVCFEKPAAEQCPRGCECLTRTEGVNRKLCNNQATSCTTAAGVNGFCYEKLPTIAPFCTYDPEQDKCVNPICPVCLSGTPKCKKFYIVSENIVRDEDTDAQFTVDSFFDVFTELSVDGAGTTYPADSFFDVFTELSVDEFAPGETVCKCVCEPTEEVCPRGCECLTPGDAKEKFGDDMKRCSPDVCGYSTPTTATHAVQPVAKYCYKKLDANECPDNCACLSEEEGKKLNYNLCNNQKRECTMVTGAKGLCFERPVVEICPKGCVCMTIEQAKKRYGDNFEICADKPCYSYVTGSQKINMYCVKEKEEEYVCPEGCVCLKREEGENKGLGICPPGATECMIPGSNERGICFELLQEERCQYNENLKKCTGGCPPGYGCVLRITAGESVVNTETGETTVITPSKRYCECIPKCPDGCECLELSEGENMNRELCLNDDGTAKQCPLSGNNPGYCFKKIDEENCYYDYGKDACVGTCPPGQKCQLNTIYRDPTTGKVTYAECHCKVPPVEECPDNCKCLTKKEGYENGLGFCNNKVTVCDYVITDALTTAAPNALGIPKYCFGEKVYAKCPDNCECMNREEAYKKGYEFCNGVVRECGPGLYCFQIPRVEICGKDTLIVTRRINPKIVSPPAYVNVYLSVKPVKNDIKGIIITEIIPEGLEPAWDYSMVSFDPDVEDKIKRSPVATEIVSAINAKWSSRRPDSWDPDTREAKWILKDKESIKPQTFMYKLKVVGKPAEFKPAEFKLNGKWLLSSGETCPIIGEHIVEIKPAEGWPPCPVSDLELLRYIDLWSKGELTDMQILQAIYVWAKKPPCSGIGVEITEGEPLPMEEVPFT